MDLITMGVFMILSFLLGIWVESGCTLPQQNKKVNNIPKSVDKDLDDSSKLTKQKQWENMMAFEGRKRGEVDNDIEE